MILGITRLPLFPKHSVATLGGLTWLQSLQVLARRTKNNPILAPQLETMMGLWGWGFSTVNQIKRLKAPIVFGHPLKLDMNGWKIHQLLLMIFE